MRPEEAHLLALQWCLGGPRGCHKPHGSHNKSSRDDAIHRGDGGANRTDNANAGALLHSGSFGEKLAGAALDGKKACDVQAGEKKLSGALVRAPQMSASRAILWRRCATATASSLNCPEPQAPNFLNSSGCAVLKHRELVGDLRITNQRH